MAFRIQNVPPQRIAVYNRYYIYIRVFGNPQNVDVEGIHDDEFTAGYNRKTRYLRIGGNPKTVRTGTWTIRMSSPSEVTTAEIKYNIYNPRVKATFELTETGKFFADVDDIERHKIKITFSEPLHLLTVDAFQFKHAEIMEAWVTGTTETDDNDENDTIWFLYFVPADNQNTMLQISVAGNLLTKDELKTRKAVYGAPALIPINTRAPEVIDTWTVGTTTYRQSVYFSFNIPVVGLTPNSLGVREFDAGGTLKIYAADSIDALQTELSRDTPPLYENTETLYENSELPKQHFRVDIDVNPRVNTEMVTLQLADEAVEAAYYQELVLDMPPEFTRLQFKQSESVHVTYNELVLGDDICLPMHLAKITTPQKRSGDFYVEGIPVGLTGGIEPEGDDNEFCLKLRGTPTAATQNGAMRIFYQGYRDILLEIPWIVTTS